MYFLWDIAQESKIAQARATAAGAAAKVSDVARYVETLEHRVDKLSLICRAMWSFLQEIADLSDEALMERVKEVDLTDGRLDGKVRQPLIKCPQCGRTMSQRHTRCLWCGAERPGSSAFDTI